jgi:hypothetical protein
LAARRRAAHLAFIRAESLFLPAAVKPPPFFFAGAFDAEVPFRCAQRALAAAASFARVAADIGLRAPPDLLLDVLAAALDPPPAKSEASRRSSPLICCLIATASCSLLRDKSMRLDSPVKK